MIHQEFLILGSLYKNLATAGAKIQYGQIQIRNSNPAFKSRTDLNRPIFLIMPLNQAKIEVLSLI